MYPGYGFSVLIPSSMRYFVTQRNNFSKSHFLYPHPLLLFSLINTELFSKWCNSWFIWARVGRKDSSPEALHCLALMTMKCFLDIVNSCWHGTSLYHHLIPFGSSLIWGLRYYFLSLDLLHYFGGTHFLVISRKGCTEGKLLWNCLLIYLFCLWLTG